MPAHARHTHGMPAFVDALLLARLRNYSWALALPLTQERSFTVVRTHPILRCHHAHSLWEQTLHGQAAPGVWFVQRLVHEANLLVHEAKTRHALLRAGLVSEAISAPIAQAAVLCLNHSGCHPLRRQCRHACCDNLLPLSCRALVTHCRPTFSQPAPLLLLGRV